MKIHRFLQGLVFLLTCTLSLFLTGLVGYIAWTQPQLFGLQGLIQPACSKPVTFSLGTIDPRFGVSQKTFLADIQQAIQIWQKPINKTLFLYVPKGGDVTMNLVYDYRQQSTQTLQKLGITISDDQSSFNALKQKYQSEEAIYEQKKAALDAQISAFNSAKSTWETEVSASNDRGGASGAEYGRLLQEQRALASQAAQINTAEQDFNATVDTVNALATELNRLAGVLNLAANKYNSIGQSTPSEFQEGVYIVDSAGRRINIYQFDSQAKLIRVLAHELGHALGLEHVNDPNAIMYTQNTGKNEKPSATDVAQLKALCGLK